MKTTIIAAIALSCLTLGRAAEVSYEQQVKAKPVFASGFEWVGSQPPESDSADLLAAAKTFEQAGVDGGISSLENFLAAHPASPWAPSVHANLGQYYKQRGRYSLALSHFEQAWVGSRGRDDAGGLKVAAAAAADRACLLGSLGRKDELDALLQEVDQLQLPLYAYATTVQGARVRLAGMKSRPTDAYRCGLFALYEMAKALHAEGRLKRQVRQIGSPDGGFSFADLLALAEANGIVLQAVRRPAGAELVLPCVTHWKLNHYAAILEKKGGQYRVTDPILGADHWVAAEVIEGEITGALLVAKDAVPASWPALSPAECAAIRGSGYPNGIVDTDDTAPEETCGDGGDADANCDPPSANDGTGGDMPPSCCPDSSDSDGDPEGDSIWGNDRLPRNGIIAGDDPSNYDMGSTSQGPYTPPPDVLPPFDPKGMTRWRVSEPYIALWLHDTPLFYRQSNGKQMTLKLSYKHRGVYAEYYGDRVPGFGDKWSCNWLGFLQMDVGGSTIDVHRAGGGSTNAPLNGGMQPMYKTATTLQLMGTNYVEVYPTGAKTRYGFVVTNGTVALFFPTERLDRYGRGIYLAYRLNSGVVQLLSVADRDGRTNTLAYGNGSFPNLITAVTNPYGGVAQFTYDNLGRLTNITDMAGMSSSFKYDTANFATNLATPYGQATFQAYAGLSTSTNYNTPYSSYNRTLLVTEPTGDHQLFAYCDNSPDGVRSSYHWNRAQYAAISAIGKTNLLGMPDDDYRLAGTRQWLHGSVMDPVTVCDTMASMAGPLDPALGDRSGRVSFAWQGQEFSYLVGTLQRVTQITRGYSLAVDITRNSLGRPLTITWWNAGNPAGYTNTYDASGMYLQKVVGPRGELVRGYGYHPVIANLLVSVTNAVGDVIRYTHDTNTMKLTSVTFPGGLVRSNIYYDSGPSKGFLKAQMDIGIRTNYFVWQNGNLVVTTNALGLVTTNTWDNLNRLVCATFPDGTTSSNLYDRLHVAGTKDRLDHWTRYGYNAVEQPVAVTNANGQVVQYDYCGCGAPSLITRWKGTNALYTQFSYDMAGRLTNTLYADGYQVSRDYDPNSLVKHVWDSGGRRVRFDWTLLGRRAGLSGAALTPSGMGEQGILMQLFDEYGRVTNRWDRNGVGVSIAYDDLGRMIGRQYGTEIYDYTGPETFVYNSLGLTNYTDSLGHLTTFVRDAAGRPLYRTNANLEVLRFTHNPANEILTLTDGKNQTTTWRYDVYGRITNKVDALGTNVFAYQYDANDRLISRTTPAKGTTYYGYDWIGNLTNVAYPAWTNVFRYDNLNRMTNMIDQVGSTVFAWTDGNQLASEDGPWAADTITYSYNSRLRSGLGVVQPNAAPWSQSYEYDGYGRLSTLTSPAGAFSYRYSNYDLVDQLTLPNGAYSSRGFDTLGRLSSITLVGAQGNDQYRYAYDLGSQRTQQVFTAGNKMNYTYDNIGQLQSALGWEQDEVTPRLHEQFGYGYDKAWNLNYRTNNALVETFGVNAGNELTSVSRSGTLTVAGTVGQGLSDVSVTVSGTGLSSGAANVYADGTWARAGASLSSGMNSYIATATQTGSYSRTSQDSVTVNLPSSNSYTYDANGNLTNDGLRTFEYDFENQLTNVYVSGQWRSEFVYDGIMRRRIRREYTWSGGTWLMTNEVRYVYDASLVIQERAVNNLPLVSYVRGLDVGGGFQAAGGVGGMLARTDHTLLNAGSRDAHAYYLGDGNGNVTCLVSTNGAIVARYAYCPFGGHLAIGGPLAEKNVYRFSSREYHENSGLLYYGYRFYDPQIQRWINRDPLEEEGGLNLSTFVDNDPMALVDTDGQGIFRAVKWIVRLGRRIGWIPAGTIPVKTARALRKAGKDVCAIGKNEKEAWKAAKDLEESVANGRPVLHHGKDAHVRNGNQPHFQTHGLGGHTFYKVAGALAVTTYLGDTWYAQAMDFFNPLSTPKDILDIYGDIFGGCDE